ncbi:MAG: C45 family peptidase [Verrucomicrobiota bacterium]
MPHSQTPWVESPSAIVDLAIPARDRFQGLSPSLIAGSRMLLSEIISEIPSGLEVMGDLLRMRTGGRFHREIRAFAELIEHDWRKVAIANISYDLMIMQLGCSTISIPTPNGPVIARNMDWFPERALAQSSCLVHYRNNERASFTNAGWPGFTGVVTGQSANGFAVILNAVMGSEPSCKTGYPVLLLMRRVLEEARGFEDALKMLRDTKLIAPGLLTLVGTENDERVVIERSPRRHALRWAKPDEVLVTTNDYRMLQNKRSTVASLEIYETTCHRYDYIREYFAKSGTQRDLEDEELLYLLSDPNVAQSITAQHVLLRPRQGSVRLFVPRHLLSEAA